MADNDYKESQRFLAGLSKNIHELYNSVGIPAQRDKLIELEDETKRDDFWQNKERFTQVNQELSLLKKRIDPWVTLIKDVDEAAELLELALAENDSSVLEELPSLIEDLGRRFEEAETKELLSGEDDDKNAFISIHPGAGGTESQDWASMLFRMYYRWAEKNGFTIDVFDYTPGEEAGLKSSTMLIKGDFSYGLLRSEMGVHRLVRISPFDANKRRHTSFASVEVMPELDDEVGGQPIDESELKIDTYRSSGAGGQHVNKTESAVRITHIPTGIVVQCQNERSQHKNKAFAMKVLKSKLYELERSQQQEMIQGKMGEKKDISWGNQIRSYVFQPYTLVKDHRTNEETGSVDAVFDGNIDRFISAYLKMRNRI